MQLHNTTKYAIRILNYIANKSETPLVSAKTLSKKLDIPYKFLSKITTILAKEELIHSVRGREGGFELAKPANEISIDCVIDLFEGSADENACLLGIGKCDSEHKCALHDQWAEPKKMMRKIFEQTTLQQLNGEEFKQ
jgi:Rrf2 family protein